MCVGIDQARQRDGTITIDNEVGFAFVYSPDSLAYGSNNAHVVHKNVCCPAIHHYVCNQDRLSFIEQGIHQDFLPVSGHMPDYRVEKFIGAVPVCP
jgi:hypothetical protein